MAPADRVGPGGVLVALVAVTLLALVSYGISLRYHHIYNLEPLLSAGIASDDHLGGGNPLSLTYYYLRHLSPLLEGDVAFTAASLLQRLVLLGLLFAVVRTLLRRNDAALAVTLLFSLSYHYYAHGLVHLGLWSKPVFFPLSLSATLLLAGTWALLRRRLAIAYAALILAMQMHPLNGVGALAYLLPGVWLHAWSEGERRWSHAAGGLALAGSLGYIAVITMGHDLPTMGATVEEWYRYAFALDADDVSALWSIGFGGFVYLPVGVIALRLSLREWARRQPLDYLVVGSFAALAAVLAVESMHGFGLFAGRFSELFIGVEPRRGMWVFALFSLARIARAVVEAGDAGLRGERLAGWGLSAATAAYLFPSGVVASLFLLGVALVRRERWWFALWLGAGALAALQWHLFGGDSNTVRALWGSLALFGATLVLYRVVASRCGDRGWVALGVPLLLFVSLALVNGVRSGRLEASFTDGGRGLAYVQQVARQTRPGLPAEEAGGCVGDDARRHPVAPGAKVVAPPNSGFRDFDFGMEVFIDGTDHDYSIFTKPRYEYLKAKLRALYGAEAVREFVELRATAATKGEWVGRLNRIHHRVDPFAEAGRLRSLGVAYWLTERPLVGHPSICRAGKYFIYRL
ncbi:hypothetical protein [Endothiovibrio diazotrophicus]